MKTIYSTLLGRLASPLRSRLRRGRSIILSIVALSTLLSATVVIGQASQDFDLACRSIMDNSGGIITGGAFAVNGALGIAVAPPTDSSVPPTYAVRSTDFGLRAGFLPGYPASQAAISADAIAPNRGDASVIIRMPLVFKMVSIVRGGCDPSQKP